MLFLFNDYNKVNYIWAEEGIKEQIKTSNKNYLKCRTGAAELMRTGKLSSKRFKAKLKSCQEKFPGASRYVNCKKNAAKKFKGDAKKLSMAARKCKEYLMLSVFQNKDAVPFNFDSMGSFFAGIGFNSDIDAKDLNLQDFSCNKVKAAMMTPDSAEFFFLGNHPKAFKNFQVWNKNQFRKLYDIRTSPPADGLNLLGFGKLFGNIEELNASVYFPTTSCVFEKDLGSIFSGLSTYYLIDHKNKKLSPYFSIAFYQPENPESNISTLQTTLLKRLNSTMGQSNKSQYQLVHEAHNKLFFATSEIKTFDKEGDPHNICMPPRKHKYLAIIKKRNDQPTFAEFILVANVKSFCDFGDRLSTQSLKK